MNHRVGSVVLRMPEPRDAEALYRQKNDPEVATLLGGFSRGYSREDIEGWLAYHRNRTDEVVWVIADADTDACVGHVGVYRIDHRIRSAEFAIMIGDKDRWGQGLGTAITRRVVDYAFEWLNLNRLGLRVLDGNERAIRVYRGLGFADEGVRRQAQYKDGRYLDQRVMGLLREEWEDHREQ